MTQPRKFTFDTEFDGDRVIAPIRPKRTFTHEEVEAIRAESFASGERSATAEAERAAAKALGEAAEAIRNGLGALTEVAHQHRSGAAELALISARKIAGAALERFPTAPLEATFEALAAEVDSAPRLVVRCATPDPARLEAALAKAADAAGYPGQVILKAEPGLTTGAFTFDWGDGRASFDPDVAGRRIDEALNAALASEGLHAEPLSGDAP